MKQQKRDPASLVLEEAYRAQAALSPTRSTDPVRLKIAERALATVDQLEAAYLKDNNPVHVWNAIMQIHLACPVLGLPFVLPPWVLAYLFSAAAMIAGAAVTTPSGDRRQTM